MTGQEVFRQALRLLGYTDTRGEPDSVQHTELYKRGLPMLNQIVCDLSAIETDAVAAPLSTFHEPLPLGERAAREVAPYGLAMLLAASQGDGDQQAFFAALYDQKRSGVRRSFEQRTDRLPRGCDL